jgi:hypothetical protein
MRGILRLPASGSAVILIANPSSALRLSGLAQVIALWRRSRASVSSEALLLFSLFGRAAR